MSLQFLLDGYNIINQVPRLVQKSLEEQREGLVVLAEKYYHQGSSKNSLTIVFDGKEHVFSPARGGPVKVVFSSGESADEKIKRIVENAGHQKSIVVVTDDRDLGSAVKHSGAKVATVKEFLAKVNVGPPAKGRRPSGTGGFPERGLPVQEAAKITDEVGRIWLDKQKRSKGKF